MELRWDRIKFTTPQVNVGSLVDRVVDEYTYAELVVDRGERLRTHWATFLTRWPAVGYGQCPSS